MMLVHELGQFKRRVHASKTLKVGREEPLRRKHFLLILNIVTGVDLQAE